MTRLAALPANWNGYGSPPPNTKAVRLATELLNELDEGLLNIARVAPSAEGGVGVILEKADRSVTIEVGNDGAIVFFRATSAGYETPEEVAAADIHDALKETADFLNV